MRPTKDQTRRRSGASSPPRAARSATAADFSSSSSFLDRPLVTEQETVITALFEESGDPEPRSFPHSVKQQCWDKAEKVKGRDPDRWRRDPLGNILFRKLVGCPGCLCHDYDHIVPYSKGGKSTLENCQVLQTTVNRSKGNQTDLSRADLVTRSSYCRVSGRDMDIIELSAYGNEFLEAASLQAVFSQEVGGKIFLAFQLHQVDDANLEQKQQLSTPGMTC